MTACYSPKMGRRWCALFVAIALGAAYGAPIVAELSPAGDEASAGSLERPARPGASVGAKLEGVRRAEARPRASWLPLAIAVAGPASAMPIERPRQMDVRPAGSPVERHAPSARVTRGPPAIVVVLS